MNNLLKGLRGIQLINNSLEPTYFNQLVDSSGQPLRWFKGTKCPCLKGGVPQENCTSCKGFGYKYTTQEKIISEFRYYIKSKTFDLGHQNKVNNIKDLRKQKSITFTQNDNMITLNEKANDIIVTYEINRKSEFAKIAIWKNPYLIISIDSTTKDVNKILKITNNNVNINLPNTNFDDISLDITGNTRLYVHPDDHSKLNNKDNIIVEFEQILPIRGSLSNVQMKDITALGPIIEQGDATLSYPSYLLLSVDDLILSLSSIKKRSFLIKKSNSNIDKLPVFEVRTLEIYSDSDTFIEGVDYFIKNGTSIIWINRIPDPTTVLSLSITYCDIYRIIGQLPSSRGHQFRAFPEKVVLKELFNTGAAKEVII